jgi:hypothetical protein
VFSLEHSVKSSDILGRTGYRSRGAETGTSVSCSGCHGFSTRSGGQLFSLDPSAVLIFNSERTLCRGIKTVTVPQFGPL